jgi:hypothetical protein
MSVVLRSVAAGALALALSGAAAQADNRVMTLRVAVDVAKLPDAAAKVMVNCVALSSPGAIYAQGGGSSDVAHSPTPDGGYVGGFNGTVLVPLYQVGPGSAAAQNGYSCSLLIVSTSGKICAAGDACQIADGTVSPWADHQTGTPFTPTIQGPLPTPSAN